ncbi:terminase family protein [Qipengyuania sp. RS5-5]|uniref:Terminase family protein n=1 Tax=Parerythrobacter lacustris TaxID=2969984 RepID=A0ABT1XRM1_9SPHN|nr:terminase family protein [Parerythrobacter lacustris]MCR2834252.1 terminase family protein [Parerythrobacter lacustris]
MAGLDEPQANRIVAGWDNHFPNFAHPGQLAPAGDWQVWLVMGGRGFGKTRAGAEWVRSIAEGDMLARIALVGATLGEARSVMVEGESGLIAISPQENRPSFEPSLHRLRWPNGAQAFLYSAAEPESLRGPQHSHAWCDEIGKWPAAHERSTRCWDNLLLGLRLGKDQRIVATTTPRNTPLVRRIFGSEGTVVTGGATRANSANLPTTFIAAMEREFGGSTLGRQELGGELIEEIEGALWSRELLERCRESPPTLQGRGTGGGDCAVAHDSPHPNPSPEGEGLWKRLIVAVDPPASSNGDACGIVVAALGQDGIARVLADASVENASPERWAKAVANAAAVWGADRVVAEANQGGAMVASVLRATDVALPLRLVHATRGKAARAEPVAALYEAGKVRHCGMFAALEDQLCGLMAGGSYEGPGRSPDRADALVWALTELMLGQKARPRISSF